MLLVAQYQTRKYAQSSIVGWSGWKKNIFCGRRAHCMSVTQFQFFPSELWPDYYMLSFCFLAFLFWTLLFLWYINSLASARIRGFSQKKRLNARGFAREFLRSGMFCRPGKSLKNRGRSSSLHLKNNFLLGGCGFFVSDVISRGLFAP